MHLLVLSQHLAAILHLSEPAISKHIKLLQDAGFVNSRRASYYVLYQIVCDPLTEIMSGLDKIFEEQVE